jgi:cell division septum initiation protein DivIVA
MDLIDRIDELALVIEEAKAVPLSSSAVINRDEILDLIAEMKEHVPEEIRQARWLARDKQDLIDRARAEAERILAEAREQRDRLLSRTEVAQAAEREAERIVDAAKERASRKIAEGDAYVDQKLAAFEILLTKTLTTVEKGRERLRESHKPSHHVPDIAFDHDGEQEGAVN